MLKKLQMLMAVAVLGTAVGCSDGGNLLGVESESGMDAKADETPSLFEGHPASSSHGPGPGHGPRNGGGPGDGGPVGGFVITGGGGGNI